MCLSMLAITMSACGAARAAPVVRGGYDLFDHLATTYPIEDWIMHARNESVDLDRDQTDLYPRYVTLVENVVTEQDPFHVQRTVGCGSARPELTREIHAAVVPDPCASAWDPDAIAFTLPARIGVRRLWDDAPTDDAWLGE